MFSTNVQRNPVGVLRVINEISQKLSKIRFYRKYLNGGTDIYCYEEIFKHSFRN
jgi:hypothetical protein